MKQVTIILATVIVTALVCLGAFYAWDSSRDNKSAETSAENIDKEPVPVSEMTPTAKAQAEARNRQELEKMFNSKR